MKRLLTNHIVIVAASIVVAALIGVGGYWYITSSRPANTNYNLVAVQRGAITEEIDVSGGVKAAEEVALAFELSGKIAHVSVSEGDVVRQGQVIASLDMSGLLAELKKAEATVSQAQDQLAELKGGTRPEQLQIDRTGIANANAAVARAQESLVNTIASAYAQSDDAVRNQADGLFSNPRSANPSLLLSVSDAQLKNDLESQRAGLEPLLTSWDNELLATSSSSDILALALLAANDLNKVGVFLNQLAYVLNNNIQANSQLSQASIDADQASISLARGEVNQAAANVSTAQGALVSATSNLKLADDKLTLDEAGATPEDIASSEANLEIAQANLDAVKAEITKAQLVAPFDGTVTNVAAKIGESATPNIPLINLISAKNFQIESYVSESDVAKLAAGMPATVTLDALGDGTVFDARVIVVNPGQTIISGISVYKVTLEFGKEDGRIKSGMTANVHIIVATHNNVLMIPRQAVITREDEKFVLAESGSGSFVERKVVLGIEDAHGMVEVLSGLVGGDQIANF